MKFTTIDKATRWAVVGDTQCPFHDPAAVELASQIIAEFEPDHIVYNGDMIDFWSLSRHMNKRHEVLKSLSLQDEIDITIQIQDKLSKGAPEAKRHQIDGNHEDRLETFLGTGTPSILGSLKSLHMEEVFQYEKRGFASYHPYGEGIWITDNLFTYHGNYVGTLPGDSVKKEIQAMGASVIMNHVHRVANLRFKQGNSEHRGIENGCLCQIAPGWKPMTNWGHALTLVTVIDKKHWFAEVVDIIRDEKVVYCIYRNTKFSVPKSYHDKLAQDWRAHRNIEFEVN